MGKIRMATAADTKAILDIYAPYIEHTNITFEYVVPTEAEFASRIEEILEKYPYLVYEEDGVIGGYAYAHQFMVRAASQWGAELSVYLAPAFQKKGLGKAFYRALMDILRLQMWKRSMAVSKPPTAPAMCSTPALVLWKRRYFLAVPSSMANGLGLCGWKNLWWNGENHCLFRRYGM